MNSIKHPPYATELRSKPRHKSVVILTGSGAWDIAKKHNSISLQPKLLLPFGENSEHFKWPVNGRDCIVLSHGEPEPYEIILKLARCLLESGATKIVWGFGGGRTTTVIPSREAA
jgi:hypothetical protein